VLAVAVIAVTLVMTAAAARGKHTRTVFAEMSGTGSARTAEFWLPERWTLEWSFDCSQQRTGPGIFSVALLRTRSGSPKLVHQLAGLVRFDTAGSGRGQYSRGGYRAFFHIASQCAWKIRAATIRARGAGAGAGRVSARASARVGVGAVVG
jgi:hypothetical protein